MDEVLVIFKRMHGSPALKSPRAIVALLVTLLQLLGALHFSLIQHSYSAALGGIVHLHAAARELSEAKRACGQRAPTATNDVPSCGADLCSTANAPDSVAPRFQALDSGAMAFGDVRLLSERALQAAASRLVLLGAPKTSPPV